MVTSNSEGQTTLLANRLADANRQISSAASKQGCAFTDQRLQTISSHLSCLSRLLISVKDKEEADCSLWHLP